MQGHIINPISFRLGTARLWNSCWAFSKSPSAVYFITLQADLSIDKFFVRFFDLTFFEYCNLIYSHFNIMRTVNFVVVDAFLYDGYAQHDEAVWSPKFSTISTSIINYTPNVTSYSIEKEILKVGKNKKERSYDDARLLASNYLSNLESDKDLLVDLLSVVGDEQVIFPFFYQRFFRLLLLLKRQKSGGRLRRINTLQKVFTLDLHGNLLVRAISTAFLNIVYRFNAYQVFFLLNPPLLPTKTGLLDWLFDLNIPDKDLFVTGDAQTKIFASLIDLSLLCFFLKKKIEAQGLLFNAKIELKDFFRRGFARRGTIMRSKFYFFNYWAWIVKDCFFFIGFFLRRFLTFGLSSVALFINFRFISKKFITASVIGQYILGRLKRRFSLPDILKPIFVDLQQNDSIIGYRVVCSGRFTRREMAIYEWYQYGTSAYGAMHRAVDYAVAFFPLKFGVGGIKIFLVRGSGSRFAKEFDDGHRLLTSIRV